MRKIVRTKIQEKPQNTIVDIDTLERGIRQAQNYLLSRQEPEGYWKGELEADASVSLGYIPLMHFTGTGR